MAGTQLKLLSLIMMLLLAIAGFGTHGQTSLLCAEKIYHDRLKELQKLKCL